MNQWWVYSRDSNSRSILAYVALMSLSVFSILYYALLGDAILSLGKVSLP